MIYFALYVIAGCIDVFFNLDVIHQIVAKDEDIPYFHLKLTIFYIVVVMFWPIFVIGRIINDWK